LAIARPTTPSKDLRSPRRTDDGTGGGADSCAHSFASSPSRSNGTFPVNA
jgi:hypothetical protein